MKVTVPLVLVLALAALAGYLLGTEQGQAQRDLLLEKLGQSKAKTDMALDLAEAAVQDAEAAVAAAADATRS